MSDDLIVPNEGQVLINNEDNLSRVVRKALQQIEDILDMELPEDESKMKLLSVKKDAASAIINAGLKADENRFRRENKDIIERLFDKIKKDGKVVDGHIARRS